MRIEVKVFPGSSRESVEQANGSLKIRVHPCAEKGKANLRVMELVAKKYGVKKKDVRILRGALSRSKVLEVDIDGEEKSGKDRDNRR